MFGKLIRTGSFANLSCTIINYDSTLEELDFLNIPFREAVYESCGIVFYKYKNTYYYPISMEFRYIDNNILFLTEELRINNFLDLSSVLKSSFKREEGRDVDFFAIIKKLEAEPRACVKMKDFIICEKDSEVIKINE